MSEEFWNNLRKAVEMVQSSGVRRADGDGFKVYSMGSSNIIRVDIDNPKEASV